MIIYNSTTLCSNMTTEEGNRLREARVGMALATMCYSHKPNTFKFPQECVGVELWRQGSSQQTIRLCHFLGMSQGPDAARSHVDKISQDHDVELLLVKEQVEVHDKGDFTSYQCRMIISG